MKLLKHGLVTFLSFMVFITSSGMTVNLHYCANQLQKVSMKHDIESCIMQSAKLNNCENNSLKISKKQQQSCCKDQIIQVKSDQKIIDNKAKEDGLFLKSITFVKNYFVSFFNFDTSNQDEEKEKEDTLFPLLKKGLYILLQQFRN